MDNPLDPPVLDDDQTSGDPSDDPAVPETGDVGDEDADEAVPEATHHLLEEYKILQAKLDRLGDFRFRVKSWAITLIMGLIVVSPKVNPIRIGCGGMLLVLAF